MSELELVLKKLKSDHGDEIGGIGHSIHIKDRISTGIFPFDLATGGGFPQGKVSIIYGPESSGKTTLAYKAIAYVQKVLEQDAVLIDIEHSFDPDWARSLGVDTEKIILLYPETAEMVVDLVEAMLYVDTVGIVVLDSVGAMITDNEVSSGAEKQIVGGSSALVSKMMRKVGSAFTKESKRGHRPTFIAVNQTRIKIGQMFGDPETMPGGNLIKFMSFLTVRLYGKDKLVKAVHENQATFKEIKGVIKKKKCRIVSTNFEFDMVLIPHNNMKFGESVSWPTVLNYLRHHGVLGKAGNEWVCFGETFKTQTAIKDRYDSDPVYQRKLQKAVVELEMNPNDEPVSESEQE